MHKINNIFYSKKTLRSFFPKVDELIIDGKAFSIEEDDIFNNFKIIGLLLDIKHLISDFLISQNRLGIKYSKLINSSLLQELKKEIIVNIRESFTKLFIFDNKINIIKAFINKVVNFGIKDFFEKSFFEDLIDKHNLRMLRIINSEIICYSYEKRWKLECNLSNKEIKEQLFRLCRRNISLTTSRYIVPFNSCIVDILKQDLEIEELLIVNIVKRRLFSFDEMISLGIIDKKNLSILETHIAVGGSVVIEKDPYGIFRSLIPMLKNRDFIIFEKEKEIVDFKTMIYEQGCLEFVEKMELDSFASNNLSFDIFRKIAYRLRTPFIASFTSLEDEQLLSLKSHKTKIICARYSKSRKKIELESLEC